MDNILSVTQLTQQIKQTLINYFNEIQIQGEIGNISNHQSGHCYFVLKDSTASIKCVVFKSVKDKLHDIVLKTDMQVIITGNLNIYESRGEYQIICSNIKEDGIGNLAIKFEQLKEKLKNKGYFRADIKKSIPKFPKKIAIITSLSGAAIKDIKFVANRRWGLSEFVIFDTLMQGNEAKYMIEKNIKIADTMGFDIIVLSRGGGSLEDLWAFNEEVVIEAIYNAKTPIISAIGHEIDTPLSDFVSDLRAPTPSACMEMILPDKNEWLLKLSDLLDNLNNAKDRNLKKYKEMLESLHSKFNFIRLNYENLENKLSNIQTNLNQVMQKFLDTKKEKILHMSTKLDSNQKNIYPLIQNIDFLRCAMHNSFAVFLSKKTSNSQNTLNLKFEIFINNKITELQNLKILLSAKNPKNDYKKGYAQITIDNKIFALSEIKKDDIIMLNDGVISKKAKIL